MSTQQEGTVYLELNVRAPKLPTQKVSSGELIPQPADERIQEIAEQVAKDFGMHPDEVVVELQKIVQAANQITQDQELVKTFTRPWPSRSPVHNYPGQVPAFRHRRPKRL